MEIQNIIDLSNNKKIYLKGFIFVFCIWILSALNYANPDMENYKNLYLVIGQGIRVKSIESGFCLFMAVTNKIGLSYNEFIFIYFTIAILIFIRALSFFEKNLRFVLGLYIIFPLFLDIVQIRNFMAMSIVLFSLRYLMKNNFLNIVLYVIGILIASTFHSIALCYLVFLFFIKREKKGVFILLIAIGIMVLLLMFPEVLKNAIHIEKAKRYMENFLYGTQLHTKILFALYFLFYAYILKLLSNNTSNVIRGSEYSKVTLVYKISKVMFIFLPILFFDVDFFRIYRNLLPVFNATICNQIKYLSTENRIFFKCILVIFMLLSFYFFIAIYTFEDVFISIMRYNYLWGGSSK